MVLSDVALIMAAIPAGEGVVASPAVVEGCTAVNPAGRAAIGAWSSEGVPVRWPGFMLLIMKGVPPVIPSYLTVTAVPFIKTVVVVSIMPACSVVGCVVTAAIGVSV